VPGLGSDAPAGPAGAAVHTDAMAASISVQPDRTADFRARECG
jgi:hypothetical protein